VYTFLVFAGVLDLVKVALGTARMVE